MIHFYKSQLLQSVFVFSSYNGSLEEKAIKVIISYHVEERMKQNFSLFPIAVINHAYYYHKNPLTKPCRHFVIQNQGQYVEGTLRKYKLLQS